MEPEVSTEIGSSLLPGASVSAESRVIPGKGTVRSPPKDEPEFNTDPVSSIIPAVNVWSADNVAAVVKIIALFTDEPTPSIVFVPRVVLAPKTRLVVPANTLPVRIAPLSVELFPRTETSVRVEVPPRVETLFKVDPPFKVDIPFKVDAPASDAVFELTIDA